MNRARRSRRSIALAQELQPWMNLYLPSVKLAKEVRLAQSFAALYSPAQTPLERVVASGQADDGTEEALPPRWIPFN